MADPNEPVGLLENEELESEQQEEHVASDEDEGEDLMDNMAQ